MSSCGVLARHPAPWVVLVLGILVLSGHCLAQGDPNEESLESLRAEVALLKRVVAEQDRRLAQLEKALELLGRGFPSANGSPAAPQESAGARGPTAFNGWKIRESWARIRDGMSEQQVQAILGPSTSTKDLGPFRTLYYEGEVPGSGSVSGNVGLRENRVWVVNVPVF